LAVEFGSTNGTGHMEDDALDHFPGPLISNTGGRTGSEVRNVKNKQCYQTQVTFLYASLFDMSFVLTPVLAALYPRDQPPLNCQILSIPLTLFQAGPGME